MVTQSEIDREIAELPGLGRIQAYNRIKARKELTRKPEFARAGYRHLLR